MSDEKLRILQMVQDGTISADEALELLQALDPKQVMKAIDNQKSVSNFRPGDQDENSSKSGRKPKFLYVQVNDNESGKNVNIKIPIALAKFAGKFVPKEAREEMKEQGIDLDLNGIMEILEEQGEQNIVEVDDGENGKIVKIFTR